MNEYRLIVWPDKVMRALARHILRTYRNDQRMFFPKGGVMFCTACGAPVQPQSPICPNCRRPLPPVATAALASRVEHHVRILGILWMIAGALFLVPGLLLITISSIVGVSIPASEQLARNIAPVVLSVIGMSLFLVAAGGILVGWGLLKHQHWARMLAIVLGAVSLLHPPFGTALGVYTLWVLLSDQGGAEYDGLTRVT